MANQPSSQSLIPLDMKPPSELKEPEPDSSDVVPDGGCRPLAEDSPSRPSKTFIPPPPKPPVTA